MTSDPDDNPFARNSAWPKMPQAPFRVGPIPKASAGPPEPPPRTVTPVFTRPAGPAAFTGLTRGGAVPGRPAPSAPAVATAAPAPSQAARRPEPLRAEPPSSDATPETAPEPYIEMAPVIVQPLGSGRRRAVARRSPAPAIAATAVGVAGVLGVAYLLNRGQAESPVVPPAVTASAPLVSPVPTPGPAVAATPAAATVALAPPTAPTRAVAVSRTRAPRAEPMPVGTPAQEPDAAVPMITLPPATVATPDPQPSFTPPAAPDPNAPMTTRRPD